MSLTISVEQSYDTTVATLVGEMDGDNCDQLGVALAAEPLTASLVVDLAGLTFIDSSGITQLVEVRAACAGRNATFALRSTSPTVRRVLEIAGMLEHFGIA